MWPEWTRGPWSEVRSTGESRRRGDRLGQQRREKQKIKGQEEPVETEGGSW